MTRAIHGDLLKRDLAKMIEATREAGLEIRRIENENGRLVIVTGKPEEGPAKTPNAFEDAEF